MNPDIKQEWVRRLLDDDTIQGIGQLHISINGENAYCCWGLLLDTMYELGIVDRYADSFGQRRVYVYYLPSHDEEICTKYPTDRMLELAGIKWDDGDTGHIVSRLSGLNDNGSNLAYIASEIMEHL